MPYKKPKPISPPILTAGQALFLACQAQLHRQSVEAANTDAEAISHVMNSDREFEQDFA
jgi:hypothetical protein